ncbi:hypothetical protein H2200_011562 [Cladophialophora chaetospira]|uniref:Uncharacterized protein n=1 Tax=Cladophialophora chaetospira TaxID=386627 RepID=A0AA39CD98_9EURO|nr:hypothetical protein H2200_011562 [Cladophialophora chaetospira]
MGTGRVQVNQRGQKKKIMRKHNREMKRREKKVRTGGLRRTHNGRNPIITITTETMVICSLIMLAVNLAWLGVLINRIFQQNPNVDVSLMTWISRAANAIDHNPGTVQFPLHHRSGQSTGERFRNRRRALSRENVSMRAYPDRNDQGSDPHPGTYHTQDMDPAEDFRARRSYLDDEAYHDSDSERNESHHSDTTPQHDHKNGKLSQGPAISAYNKFRSPRPSQSSQHSLYTDSSSETDSSSSIPYCTEPSALSFSYSGGRTKRRHHRPHHTSQRLLIPSNISDAAHTCQHLPARGPERIYHGNNVDGHSHLESFSHREANAIILALFGLGIAVIWILLSSSGSSMPSWPFPSADAGPLTRSPLLTTSPSLHLDVFVPMQTDLLVHPVNASSPATLYSPSSDLNSYGTTRSRVAIAFIGILVGGLGACVAFLLLKSLVCKGRPTASGRGWRGLFSI